ncbi:EamA family transporter [Chloroflexota bacterium]
MNAVFLSIIGAFSFAFGDVFARRAVVQVLDAALGLLIIIPLALPFFTIILIFTSQIGSILSFSWPSYLWLSAAGIVTFVLGGPLYLKSVQLVGANATSIITRFHPLFSVIIGVSILGVDT